MQYSLELDSEHSKKQRVFRESAENSFRKDTVQTNTRKERKIFTILQNYITIFLFKDISY